MGVRFIIGRAGTGKTHHCLDTIRHAVQESPVDGRSLLLLVPEQAALQMERAILSLDDPSRMPQWFVGGLPAAHRAEVLSFQRLALRVLESVAGPGRLALSEPARAMALRYLVGAYGEELQYYGRVARTGASAGRLGGFIGRLEAAITEFIQEGIDPEQLARAAGLDSVAVGNPGGDDPAARAKLHDLHLIYRAYLDYLGEGRLDPSQYLEAARARLRRWTRLDGARLWVDGFASLSGQESETLVALGKQCQSVDITIMMDPCLHKARQPASGSRRDMQRLFARTWGTYLDLCERFTRAGLEIMEPVMLDGAPVRFRTHGRLAMIEPRLFLGAVAPAASGAPAVPRQTGHAHEAAPKEVEIVELPSRRLEVDYAVSRILGWVQDAKTGYRYRDTAIIVRDLEPYHALLRQALEARQIPCFIDRRRPVAHHPLVLLLQAAPALVIEDLSLEAVRSALKTGLLPVSFQESDELENFLLAHGVTGADAWRGGDWTHRPRATFGETERAPTDYETALLARVNGTRRKLMALFEPWLAFAHSADPHNGPAWTQAIEAWLNRVGAGATLQHWAGQAEAEGDLDQAEEHRQVWRDVASFLDDLAFTFTDAVLTVQELADVLDTGLGGLTLGLVPPTVDQVLVGSIERSRHPDLKAALVLGFNDGVFPQRLSEDSILNDEDRTRLLGAGVPVRLPMRDRALDEALLVYTALTRPSEALVITCPAADQNGQTLRPSPYIETLRAACPGLTTTIEKDPRHTRALWDILSTRDLVDRLASEFRTRPDPDVDDQACRGRWNGLYETARAGLAATATSRRAMASLDEIRGSALSVDAVERWHGGTLRTSVSELETFAACPFQRFAKYVLRLGERAEAALEPVDVGKVHHAVLEDFVRAVADRGERLSGLGESELLDGLQESCRRVGARLPASGPLSGARNAYQLGRSAAELARVLQTQRRLARANASRPHGAEVSFGIDKAGGLPAMGLSTPTGRRVLVRGYIDRVDLAELGDELLGIVIDYKRTREKSLGLSEVYHGLSLQLLAYLLVLRELGHTLAGRPIKPIAGLYVSLAPRYHNVDHPKLLTEREKSLHGAARPRGLLLADEFGALDSAAAPGTWSTGYNVYLKKDGVVGRIDQSDAAYADAFGSLLEHTRSTLGALADGILDGCVAVKPYRLGALSPCSWCPLPAVCRFEMGLSEARFLERLRRSEVFHLLTRGLSNSPPATPA
jgi:ATP-dependent helicase/nuclease subunit B